MPDMHEVQKEIYRENDRYWAHQSANGPSTTEWHVDALCERLGFSNDEANIIKCELNCIFQSMFGGNIVENVPQQFGKVRSLVRKGDPKGLFGYVFQYSRRLYYALENVPIVNDLRLWATLDRLVLARSEDPVVKRFINAIERKNSLSRKTVC